MLACAALTANIHSHHSAFMLPMPPRRDRDGYLLANRQGVRLPAAADPLGRADYLAVAQAGGAGKDGRNQSIFLAAALPVSAFEKELAHLVSDPSQSAARHAA